MKVAKKARVNFTLDEELYKKMQFYGPMFGINWSQVIEQSLMPMIVAFDETYKSIEASGEKDVTKIKMLFQKLLFGVTGRAYDAYEAIEKDLDKAEVAGEKKVSKKKRTKTGL